MSTMPLALEILMSLFIVAGGLFALIGSWGLVRLPSLMTRLHGPTKATTLGVGGMLIASMIQAPTSRGDWSGHELLITLFLFLTAPISANLIAKAYLHRRRAARDPDPASPPDGDPPPSGTGHDWATFAGADHGAAPSARPPLARDPAAP